MCRSYGALMVWLLLIIYRYIMPNGIFLVFNAVRHDISVKTNNPPYVFELRRSDTFKTYKIPCHGS